MKSFIEQNRKWLRFYSTASRILGWIMILSVSVAILSMMKAGWGITQQTPEEQKVFFMILGTVVERIFDWLPIGFILLGIGQFLKYICFNEHKMPWLLKHGTKLLYLFAVLGILRPFIFFFYHQMMNMNLQVRVITSICFLLANVLVLIGLADILKRILPIIEEYKLLI